MFPAGPLARGPWSLRTLCIVRTPFVLAEQPRREWASQAQSDCLGLSQKKTGATFPTTGHRKSQPITPRVTPRLTKRNMTCVPVCGVSGSLVGVHTCD